MRLVVPGDPQGRAMTLAHAPVTYNDRGNLIEGIHGRR